MISIEETLAQTFVDVLNRHSNGRERTHQGRQGYIGPSDLGFCRQKALLTLMQTESDVDDSIVGMWPADVGTAIHTWVDDAFEGEEGWLRGADIGRVTARFPESNAEVSGTIDLCNQPLNVLVDVKTVDGYDGVKNYGVSQNHLFQGHTYALGLIEAGILVEEGLKIAWVFLDRSGREKRPYVVVLDFDPTLTAQVDSWIADVIYARVHSEDAPRDIPSNLCKAMACRFFTTCRGVMEDTHDPELLDHPDVIRSVDMYLEGKELEGRAKSMISAARSGLVGANGVTPGGVQVRWVHVNPSPPPVNPKGRPGYERLDVRRVKS